jgi:chromosome segregation ATPase
VPTQFELERIRGEIAQMENDIDGMIKPLAAQMVDIEDLRKEVKTLHVQLEEKKKTLLTMTSTLQGGEKSFEVNGFKYDGDRAQTKLQRDFNAFKRLEQTVNTKEKLLDAKERQFQAPMEQTEKLMSKKNEYAVRLANLEAEEERLQVERIGSVPTAKSNHASEIEGSLRDLERRLAIEKKSNELRNGPFRAENSETPVENQPQTNLQEIRNYLEGNTPERTQTVNNEE